MSGRSFAASGRKKLQASHIRGTSNGSQSQGNELLYTAGLIYAAGAKHLLLSAAIYGPGTILYFMARREQSTRAFTPAETAIFMVAAVGAVVAILGIATGRISI